MLIFPFFFQSSDFPFFLLVLHSQLYRLCTRLNVKHCICIAQAIFHANQFRHLFKNSQVEHFKHFQILRFLSIYEACRTGAQNASYKPIAVKECLTIHSKTPTQIKTKLQK